MKFINKYIKEIYAIQIILIVIASFIKTYYCEEADQIIVMGIPLCMLMLGVLAGPIGSLILGIAGTIIVYFVF